MLRAMMVRRCATYKLWGQDLLLLPQGVVELIDFPLKSQSSRVREAYLALECQEKEDASKKEDARKSPEKSAARSQREFQAQLQGKAYLKCRVASTLPAICLLPGLTQESFLKPWVEEMARLDRERGNQPSI